MKFNIKILPMSKILCDHTFNCRGYINPMTCYDLAKDIKENGLDTPISVWGYKDPKNDDIEYQVLAGHRRFTAFQINGETEIPCYVRTDITTEYEALALNLRENIQRSELSLAQEAKRVQQLMSAGRSSAQVAISLGKSTAWLEPRRKLMELPVEVIDAAEKNIINQSHIAMLYEYRNNPAKLREVLLQIKQRFESGEKGIQVKKEFTVGDLAKVRKPKPMEIEQLRELIFNNITLKIPDPAYFANQIMSWILGDMSQAQIYRAYIRECEALGLEVVIPSDIETLLSFVPEEESV